MPKQPTAEAAYVVRARRAIVLGVVLIPMCLCVYTFFRADPAAAATSSTVNFQARLETATGAIAPDGNYNVEFKLYNASSSSGSSQGSCTGDVNCLWVESRTGANQVRVANGYLTVNLGSVTSFPTTINWNQQLWLTMNIGGTGGTPSWDGEMSPRLQLTAEPYAFQAGTLSATSGVNVGTLSFGTISATDTISLPDASGTVCLQSSSACGFASGTGTAFVQGGNSFGAQAVLGTNDSNSLAVRTTGTNRLVIDTAGNVQLQQASVINIASAASGAQLTIKGGDATAGINVGGTLLLQGGAGASTGASGSVIVKANTNDSATAFQVQNASGSAVFTADTTNSRIAIGNLGTATAQLYVSGVVPSAALGSVSTGAGSQPFSLSVQGRYAYVVTNSSNTLQVFDVSNPASPTQVGSVSTGAGSNPETVSVVGRYAYVTDNTSNALQIFDVSNPASPSLVGNVATDSGAYGVYVRGRYAYVNNQTANTLQIFDVSNPASPTRVGSTATGNSPRGLSVQGRYVYITNASGNTLTIYDVSNPASPSLVGSVSTGAVSPRRVSVVGRYAYVTGFNGNTLQIFDVSNPASPTQVGSNIATGTNPHTIYVQGRYAYVVNTGGNTLQIFDVSNPASVTSLGTVATGVSPHDVFVAGRYAYIVNNSANTLATYDLGGAYVQQLQLGGLETGTLQTTGSATITGDAAVQGGLQVGASVGVSGTLGVTGATYLQSTLAVGGGIHGGVTITGLSTPAAPSVTPTGGTGATSYSYVISAVSPSGGQTPASAAGSTSTGSVALSATVYNALAWSPVADAVSYTVYRTVGGGSTGLIGTTNATTFNDTGVAATSAAPTQDTSGQLTVNGYAILKNTVNTTTAFQVQNASGTGFITGDSTDGQLILGTSSTLSGQLAFATAGGGTVTITPTSSASNFAVTFPAASGTVCLQSASACGFATGSGSAFLQGGNSFGVQAVFGTNDSNSVAIRTGGTSRLVIDTSGNLQLQQASTFNLASAASGAQLTIQAGAATSGTNTGGTLLLEGGAGASTGASGAVIVKANTNDSTAAFQVQNAAGANLFTVDTQNTVIVLGNDSSPIALTVRGGAATGSDTPGANITFDASNGTGAATSGDFIFRTAGPIASPITLDATSNSSNQSTSLTWSHTTTSTANRILLVGVGSDGGANNVSSVTYNGVALTKIASQTCASGGTCDEELWYLYNPSSGAHNIVVSLSSNQEIFGGAATYYNVNATTPLGTAATNSGTATTTSVSVSSNATQLVVDGVMDWSNGSLGNSNAGQTQLWKTNLFGYNSGGSSKPGAATSTSLGWSVAGGTSWAEVGVPLNPLANSTPDTLTDRLHITAAGNVGIDNASPQYALDVVGTGNFSTSVLTPMLDTATSVALTIGNTKATGISLGNSTSNIQTTVNGTALIKPTSGHDSTTAFQVQNASGTAVLNIDTITGFVGISTAAPSADLTFGTGADRTIKIESASAGNNGNSLTIQAGNGNGTSKNGGNLILQGGNSTGSGTPGGVIVKPQTDASTAFQVQSSSAAAVLTVDTVNARVSIGTNGTATSQLYVSGSVPGAAVGSVSTGASSTPYGIAVQGRYAYVVSNAANTLQIFDVSNPANPTALGSVATGTTPNQVAVRGRYAYVTNVASNTLTIYDVSNPSSPTQVTGGSVATNTGPRGLYIRGRYAFVTASDGAGTNTLQIFDVTNPAAPTVAGSITTGSSPRGVAVQGSYAYVANSFSNTLTIYDVSNPASPTSVGSVATGTKPERVAVVGRYAYVVNNTSNTLQIFDVSNPASPTQVGGNIAAGTNAHDVYIQGRFAYVTNTGANTLQVFDISNPTSVTSVGTIPTGTNPHDVVVVGRYAYLTTEVSNTLQVFDVGGAYLQQLEVGGTDTGTLQVNSNATIGGDQNIQGGLSVGRSAVIQGDLGVAGSLSLLGNDNILSAAANAGANYGILNIGSGGFAGSAGNFVGSSSGTQLAINAPSGYAGNLVDFQVTGASRFLVDQNGQLLTNAPSGYTGALLTLKLNGTTLLQVDAGGHLISGGTAPTIAANAGNTGSGSCSLSASATDTKGVITITTGTGATANGTMCTITFAHAYASAPTVVISAAAGNTPGRQPYSISPTSTTSFSVGFNNAPATSTTYTVDYIMIQ